MKSKGVVFREKKIVKQFSERKFLLKIFDSRENFWEKICHRKKAGKKNYRKKCFIRIKFKFLRKNFGNKLIFEGKKSWEMGKT